MEITSTSNKRVKFWEKLKEKKYRDEEKLFLVEDEHLVNEALKKGIVKEIITLRNESYEVDTYYVTENIMKKISSQVSSAKIIAVCHMLEEKFNDGNIIILDGIQDPGNLGTIIRSAVAFNFSTIVLSKNCVDIYNPKVVRASEGMLFHINFIKTNLIDFINNLDDTYTVVGTDVENGLDIRKIQYDKIAIIIGNEGYGVSEEIKEKCSKNVYIKMNKNCESLNAGVSASILMYEVNYE